MKCLEWNILYFIPVAQAYCIIVHLSARKELETSKKLMCEKSNEMNYLVGLMNVPGSIYGNLDGSN